MRKLNVQSGFTLVELLIVSVVLSILAVALAPVFGSIASSWARAQTEKSKLYNGYLGDALVSYAQENLAAGAAGTLPAPYTGAGYTSTVFSPSDVSTNGIALKQKLTQQNVPITEINDDGTAGANVRVYQRVAGLIQQMPMYFQSGPLVTLTYQYGAIYTTACPKSTSACNPSAATGVPGSSAALTALNYTTWTTSGTDGVPYVFSSLPVQRSMLTKTTNNLDKLRDYFVSYYRASQQKAAAADTTNWYPSGASSLEGQTPGTNQGCRDGWYNLATDTTILQTVGLTSTELGSTAWGGAIQYCRDYDPTGTKGANTAPFYGAFRILGSVSSGSAPDSVATGNNVVLSF